MVTRLSTFHIFEATIARMDIIMLMLAEPTINLVEKLARINEEAEEQVEDDGEDDDIVDADEDDDVFV